ncbi:hypothetical protein H4R20_001743 [Coemansia guatemalensis]|uniref:Thioredoxin domain-containing protein n=1 Tax=Coemansia guatemalensis TaxID=2761395 RepID=A0A9W8I589_9FUNG|nr:hypothetical protein H4R20_001743 [Coemansia guatemalensis]
MAIADIIQSPKHANDTTSDVNSPLAKKRKLEETFKDSSTSESLTCLIGTAAPKFSAPALLPDGSFSNISLESFRGQYVVLVFYSGDFNSKCSSTLNGFSNRHAEFAAENSALLFCSTDSEFVHFNWAQMDRSNGGIKGVAVPILTDRSRMVSRSFGMLDDSGHSFEGVFLIDREGVMRCALINSTPLTGSVEEVLRLVRETKATDETNKC